MAFDPGLSVGWNRSNYTRDGNKTANEAEPVGVRPKAKDVLTTKKKHDQLVTSREILLNPSTARFTENVTCSEPACSQDNRG